MGEPLLLGRYQVAVRSQTRSEMPGRLGASGAPAVSVAHSDHAPVPFAFCARDCTS